MFMRYMLVVVAIGFAATSRAQVPLANDIRCVQTERDYLVAYANMLRQEIAIHEQRLVAYEPITRFDSSAIGMSRDHVRLAILRRRMELEMVRNQLRALGRSYAW